MENEDPLGRKLRYLNLMLLAFLLVASTVFVFRLAGLVGETHKTLVAMSQDLKSVSTAAGNISRDVETLRGQMHDLQDKVDKAIPDEKVTKAWHDTKIMKEGLTAKSTSLPEKSQKEIEQLLAALTESPFKYKRKENTHSIAYLYTRIYPKYLSMRKTLTSSEDFIEQVGSQTMFGNDYIVVGTNGVPMKLGDWFHKELGKIRDAQQLLARDELKPRP